VPLLRDLRTIAIVCFARWRRGLQRIYAHIVGLSYRRAGRR
jgi:hypothetical protein